LRQAGPQAAAPAGPDIGPVSIDVVVDGLAVCVRHVPFCVSLIVRTFGRRRGVGPGPRNVHADALTKHRQVTGPTSLGFTALLQLPQIDCPRCRDPVAKGSDCLLQDAQDGAGRVRLSE
jgi:hypothetical protein